MNRSMFCLTAALAALTVNVASAEAPSPAMETFSEDAYAGYDADLDNGERVFLAAGCGGCHGLPDDPLLLAGGQKIDTKFGALYSPNITSDMEHGIGGWSNAQFLNAVLLGQKPDGGQYYGAVFPYASYAYMTAEDALDIRGYIASLPSSDAPRETHEVNIANDWVLSAWNEAPVALAAQTDPQLERGQYLVEALGHCGECHTPRRNGLGFKNDRDQAHAFEGEAGLLGGYAPNIAAARLAGFDPEAFVTGALRNGTKLNGRPMTDPRMRQISAQLGKLPVEDRAAIYAYLTGAPMDVSSLAEEPSLDPVVEVSAVVPTQVVEDTTGAEGLMQRVNAYCEAQADAADVLTAAPTQVAAGVDPALEEEVDALVELHCRNCHGPGQTYQKAFFTGDMIDIARDPAIVTPGNPGASPLYESIASNRMPVGSKITPEELQKIGAWVTALNAPTAVVAEVVETPQVAETPILPRFAGGSFEELLFAASQDLMALPENDRPFMRFMSFAHVPLPEVDCTQEGAMRNPMTYLHAGMNKFINSVSRGHELARVRPVSGTEGALVRIDMRDYGWSNEDWQSLTTAAYTVGAAEAGWSPEAWADLAAVYPYATDPTSQPLLANVAAMTETVVPVLRAEWFVRRASESPFYDLLLRLPGDIRILEARMGVNVDQAIQSGDVLRTGFVSGASGVSDFNRMLERHSLPRDGYYWKSYDFAGDTGAQSLIHHPDGPALTPNLASGTEGFEHDGGEMIFSLANGMQGYYLSTHEGERLTVGPTSIVSFRTKPIGKGVEIVNARSCFDCHANGIIAKRDQMRQFIETSVGFDLTAREALLEMYRPQEEVDRFYSADAKRFIEGLETLGATEPSPDGRPVSINAPDSAGGGENVTYLADLYFENLTAEDVAREFFMDSDMLRERARRIADPGLRQVADTWAQRLDRDLFVTRAELEEHWQELLPRLTRMSALAPDAVPVTQSPTDLTTALSQSASYSQQAFVPADNSKRDEPVQTYTAGTGLTLSLAVPTVSPRVGDLLTFDVTANKRCELQILYVEEGNVVVEELPQSVLGAAFLEAGETRSIPDPASGLQLRFNTPGRGETMLAFCREGGLGDQRIDVAEAIAKARARSRPLTKGLSIEVATRVQESAGASALNAVTFNVSP